MKRLLIIPHHPNFRELKIRLAEMAGWLSETHEVLLLDWHSSFGGNGLWARILSSLKDLFRPVKISRYQAMDVVEVPLLHRPLALVPFFNTYWLKRLIMRLDIDIVVNGSYYLFACPHPRKFRYIVDLADLPQGDQTAFDEFINDRLRREIGCADGVSVASRGLVSYVKRRFGSESVFIPNGADIARYRDIDRGRLQEVRARYGLQDKWVISHIGYLGEWVDLDFLVRVFRKVEKADPDAVLLVVGEAPSLEALRKRYESKNIVFTGPIKPEQIPLYFQVSDIGVLPNKKTMFQDFAFHIKLIEYAAARKHTLSSDLEETKRLGFPSVHTVPLDENAWAKVLGDLRSADWKDEWDASVDAFDWKKITRDYREFLEKP